MSFEDITFITVTVTCGTDGCENEGITLTIDVPDIPNPQIICGPCGAPLPLPLQPIEEQSS